MANRLLVVVLLLLAFHHKGILGSHFRGGTISWRATGHGNQVLILISFIISSHLYLLYMSFGLCLNLTLLNLQ